ncbi:RDD family protein [Mycobacterium vicinigordonae]|uniref:RDD family protein n=1 Tax=Mycobacterium vicinigordonae TaxID=1719132 RepID=A0A7D6E105_9MYCO|nr:RDD family protein [Mycobacterium vicinigordonae]QLL07201.1 RDD family protein [Mycobacterium vicinigordonae]
MSEVVTGDAVVLDVQIAQLPVRALSALLDVTVVFVFYFVGLMIAAAAMSQMDEAWIVAFIIIFTVLAMVGYPVTMETLTRGRSLGKMALGLRVVSDDGGPERFRQALFRALAAVVEIWMLLGSPAVICSLFSPKAKRVGDLFAGTVVVSERGPRLAPPPMMPPQLAGWAAALQLSGLSAGQAEVARQFLSRAMQLDPRLREQMAYRIAGDVLACVAPPPPPGVPPQLVLAAVLAERHRRELARMRPAAAPVAAPAMVPPNWPPPMPQGWPPAPIPAQTSATQPQSQAPPEASDVGGFAAPS